MFAPCISSINSINSVNSIEALFIIPTDAHNYKIIGMLKTIKIPTIAPTCFGSRRNHHQGAISCLAKTTIMILLCSSLMTWSMLVCRHNIDLLDKLKNFYEKWYAFNVLTYIFVGFNDLISIIPTGRFANF